LTSWMLRVIPANTRVAIARIIATASRASAAAERYAASSSPGAALISVPNASLRHAARSAAANHERHPAASVRLASGNRRRRSLSLRAVVQRVRRGRVTVDGKSVGSIAAGLVALLGVAKGDTSEQAAYLADKTAHLRIFNDAAGKMNLSLLESRGAAL